MNNQPLLKRSFSAANNGDLGFKTQKTLPDTKSGANEEPNTKEKQPRDSSAPKKTMIKGFERLNNASPSSGKQIVSHQSFMFHNPSPSLLSPAGRPQESVIGTSSSRNLKKFGTVAGDTLPNDLSPLVLQMPQSPSSNPADGTMKVKFREKEEWIVGDECHLCKREFKTMGGVFKHHCRVCGKTVCKDCSSKKIVENRVCDLCYYKASNQRAQNRREDQLKLKEATKRTYKKQYQKEKDDLGKLIQNKHDLDKKMKEEKEDQTKALTNLQKEKDKVTEILTKKKDTNVKLKETLAVDKNFLQEKEIELEELRNNINMMKTQISHKKTNYELKKEELHRLIKQVKEYEGSPSFLDIVGNLPADESYSMVQVDTSATNIGIDRSNKASIRRDLTKN